MKRIIITVDLGHFKAYKISKTPMNRYSATLIESYDSIDAHGKLGEKLSDQAGRFSRGEGQKGIAKGYGEPHNLKLDTEKKLITLIAKDINTLIAGEDCDRWNLAAPERINRQIIDKLHPEVKAKLDKTITADLTNTDKSEILSHFE
jgi:hypothetical protein